MGPKRSVPVGRSPCLTRLPHQSSSLPPGKTVSVSIAPQGFESGGHFINFPYVWLSPGPPSSELAPFCGKWQSLDTILSRVCSVTCVCFSTVSVPAVPTGKAWGCCSLSVLKSWVL